MNDEKYFALMDALNYGFDNDEKLIIRWNNGLLIRCKSITGEYETDTEPEDEDYIGEYAAVIGDVEIMETGNDESILIYNDCIEISLKCIPQKMSLEDGTILWERQEMV